jgi:hypothetical protein
MYFRKNMRIMISRSMKPSYLTGGKLYVMSLETYRAVRTFSDYLLFRKWYENTIFKMPEPVPTADSALCWQMYPLMEAMMLFSVWISIYVPFLFVIYITVLSYLRLYIINWSYIFSFKCETLPYYIIYNSVNFHTWRKKIYDQLVIQCEPDKMQNIKIYIIKWFNDLWIMNWKRFGSGHGLIKVICWPMPGRTKENHRSFSQDSWCPHQDSNRAP